MQEYNKWANEMNVGAYYVPPMPPANGHYFDADVYKKQRELSIMKRLLKLLGFFCSLSTMRSWAKLVFTK